MLEIISIALSGLAVLLLLIVLIVVVKNNKQGQISLSERDLKNIRASVNEAVTGLSISVSNLVAEKNKNIVESLTNNYNEVNKKMATLNENIEKNLTMSKEALDNIHNSFNTFVSDTLPVS